MENLQMLYNDWRNRGEEGAEGTNVPFTWDCGEKSAREDFTEFADLENSISFEEMSELEKEYNSIDWNTVEEMKEYIKDQIQKNGFDENNQIEIDFADLCEEVETIEASLELGYQAELSEGEGVWWIYKE